MSINEVIINNVDTRQNHDNDKSVQLTRTRYSLLKKVIHTSVSSDFPHYLRFFPRYTDPVDVAVVHDIRVQQHQGTEEERQEE